MKLTELEPKFLKMTDERNWKMVDDINSDGIFFLCPKCFEENKGNVGTHGIVCWSPHIPISEHLTGPGRWSMKGTGYEDLTSCGWIVIC